MLQELEKRIEAGLIKAAPNGDLTIYNYTPECVHERAWDEFTLAARGLVLNGAGRVVARPWPKFFNLGERPEEKIPAETPELANKYDGSLIIVFFDEMCQSWRPITRGSWDNPQTRAADGWLKVNDWLLEPSKTYLFELVAPWNRIVVHYKVERMVLIGVVDTASGEDLSYADTRQYALDRDMEPLGYQVKPLDEVDLEANVENEEGFVARFSNGFRVKLKYKEYLRLHKLVTGLSIKGIWAALSNGEALDLSSVPDEFMGWFNKQAGKLQTAYAEYEMKAKEVFSRVGEQSTRRDYAERFLAHGRLSGVLFKMLDGKPYSDSIWKMVKPSHHEVFTVDEA